jgi:hypothetical protein
VRKKRIITIILAISTISSGFSTFFLYEASFSHISSGACCTIQGSYVKHANETVIGWFSVSSKDNIVFRLKVNWRSDHTLNVRILSKNNYDLYKEGKPNSPLVNISKQNGSIDYWFIRPNITTGRYYLLVSVDRNIEKNLSDNDTIGFRASGGQGSITFVTPYSLGLYDAGMKPFYLWSVRNEQNNSSNLLCGGLIVLIICYVTC